MRLRGDPREEGSLQGSARWEMTVLGTGEKGGEGNRADSCCEDAYQEDRRRELHFKVNTQDWRNDSVTRVPAMQE